MRWLRTKDPYLHSLHLPYISHNPSLSILLIFSAQQRVSTDRRNLLTGREYSGGSFVNTMYIDTTVVEEKCTRNDDDNDTTEVVFVIIFRFPKPPPPPYGPTSTSEVFPLLTTTHIRWSRIVRRLEGNTVKCAGGAEVAHGISFRGPSIEHF
jgi:hypothetical protein